MSVKKAYNRYFIIFQEEDKGYGIKDKEPAGYLKIESKDKICKITAYVQNLIKDKGPYSCFLINPKKEPPIAAKLGDFNLDETGRGEVIYEYDIENIAGTREGIDNFTVAGIFAESNLGVIAPLVGYTGKERVEWRNKVSFRIEKEKVKEEVKPVKDDFEENFEEGSENINRGEDNFGRSKKDDEAKKFEEYEDNIKKIIKGEDKKEHFEHESEFIYPPKDEEYMGHDYEFKKGEMKEDHGKSHSKMFCDVLKNYEELKELTHEIKDTKWWKVPFTPDMELKDNKYYPYYCAIQHLKMTYPYINYIKYFKKHGHYNFGIKYDEDGEVKYIIYGIEGENSMEDQPYMGMTGFVKWMGYANKGGGMWVMCYNPYTGCIMVPKKKNK